MLRQEVADHYRAKGYSIRERVQVRGRSGTVHSIDMVAQGPLGNLVIAFEDESGFEAPELGSVRRSARDIGATPVVALRRIPDGLRRKAAAAGVVMLDEEAMRAQPAAAPAPPEPEEVPWPDPEARRRAQDERRPEKSTDPGFWKYPRPGAAGALGAGPGPGQAFSWLPAAPSPATPAGPVPSPAPHRAPSVPSVALPHRAPSVPSVPRPAPAVQGGPAWWQWALAAAIFGGAAGGAFYAFLRILG